MVLGRYGNKTKRSVYQVMGGAIYIMDRKEYLRQYRKEYRKIHKEELREKAREYYHSKDGKEHKRQVLKNKLRRRKLRIKAIEHYGSKCSCCGEKTIEFLCIDHKNNDGSSHRKTMTTRSIGEWLYRHNYPEGFQVLCHNCNMAKGLYGKCPHKD